MADMLVKLYALPPLGPALIRARQAGIEVRRALVTDKPAVLRWIARDFATWHAEVDASFARLPVACHLAVRGSELAGFACHDAIAPNFFGPAGVAESARGQGAGSALLLAALHAQRAQGYAYAIIGGVGPADFYARTVGAVPIAASSPGLYAQRLAAPAEE